MGLRRVCDNHHPTWKTGPAYLKGEMGERVKNKEAGRACSFYTKRVNQWCEVRIKNKKFDVVDRMNLRRDGTN